MNDPRLVGVDEVEVAVDELLTLAKMSDQHQEQSLHTQVRCTVVVVVVGVDVVQKDCPGARALARSVAVVQFSKVLYPVHHCVDHRSYQSEVSAAQG